MIPGGGISWVRLGEVASFKTGVKPKEILENYVEGAFYYINAGTTPSGYVIESNREKDIVTTPSRGQGGIGFVGYQNNPFWLGPLCYGIQSKNKDIITNKFIYHCLCNQTNDILSRKNEGGTPALNANDLGTIKIPVPSLSEQNRIVKILDKFDKLTNDLTEGLPAEIAARKQQYEYYMDKLLSFEEK